MTKNKAIMVVPNTKAGWDGLKYLSSVLVKEGVLIKLVSKKEFDFIIKVSKGESKC